MGNFDGVHRGHAEIIGKLKSWAQKVGGPSVVFTFDPHPVRLLRPELAPPPLTWTQRKAELLGELDVDCMIAWPTDRELLNLEYDEFFSRVIVEQLRAAAIVEGPNFFFGRNREGDVGRLAELCNENSVHCEIVEPRISGDELISSTRIRTLIQQGDVASARKMLTRPYRIRGMVIHGAGRGAGLGFPTANLDAIDTLIPAMGVYAGLANVEGADKETGSGKERKPAAIHIGPSPTFGTERPSVEIHILDFARTIYGEVVEVDFLESLRGIEQFESVDDLKNRVAMDIARAREIGAAWCNE